MVIKEQVIKKKVNFLLTGLILLMAGMMAAAVLPDGAESAFKGFIAIQVHPARLITDFIEIGGINGAFLNAVSVGAVGCLLIVLSGIQFSGPTYAAVFTMIGFGLFGKTPLNILPIILGVYISARIVDKKMGDYLIIALFGTALGPLVTTLAFEIGLSGAMALGTALFGGVLTGFFLPAVAVSMLHLHQGYNLYNMGLSCGFFGLFAAAVIKGFGHEYTGQLNWYSEDSLLLVLFIPVLSCLLLLFGLLGRKKKILSDQKEIMAIPGRLPSDFMDMVSIPGALFNSGLIGLAGSVYLMAAGADFNGPVIGGMLTIMGFGAFGIHLRNAWPVVSGAARCNSADGEFSQFSRPRPCCHFLYNPCSAGRGIRHIDRIYRRFYPSAYGIADRFMAWGNESV